MTIFIARTPYKVTIAPTFSMLKLTLIVMLVLLSFSNRLSAPKMDNVATKPYNQTATTGEKNDYVSIK